MSSRCIETVVIEVSYETAKALADPWQQRLLADWLQERGMSKEAIYDLLETN